MSIKTFKTLLAVTLTLVSTAAFGLAPSGQFEQTITQSGGKRPGPATVTQIIRWSGNKFRAEESNSKQKRIVIGDGKSIMFYDPATKSAMSNPQPADPAMKNKNMLDVLFASTRQMTKGAKKVGTGKVGGFTCDIYEFTHPMGKVKVNRKSWVNKDPKFPIEVKRVTIFGKDSMTMTIKNVKLGTSFPASMFSLPKGTKIVKHPAMGMPNPHGMSNPHKGGTAPKR